MSISISLVKYALEGGIPIDESSENLESSFISDNFHEWLVNNNHIEIIKIKETADDDPLIQISIINTNIESLAEIKKYIEKQVFIAIRAAHSAAIDRVIVETEVKKNLDRTYIWLKLRFIFNEAHVKHIDNANVKLVIG